MVKKRSNAPWFVESEKKAPPKREPRCSQCHYMVLPPLNRMRGERAYCNHPSTKARVNRTVEDFKRGGQLGPGSPQPNWCPLLPTKFKPRTFQELKQRLSLVVAERVDLEDFEDEE